MEKAKHNAISSPVAIDAVKLTTLIELVLSSMMSLVLLLMMAVTLLSTNGPLSTGPGRRQQRLDDREGNN